MGNDEIVTAETKFTDDFKSGMAEAEGQSLIDYKRISDAVAWGILKAMIAVVIIGLGLSYFMSKLFWAMW